MSEESMPNIPERRSGIVFDKTISLGNVLTIVGMILLGLGAFNNLDKRVVHLETKDISRDKEMLAAQQQSTLLAAEQRQDFREMRQRMDALKDAVLKKN